MQAFIKDKNKLIINSQIIQNEKEDLINFAKAATENGVIATVLYDTEGLPSGIEFEVIDNK